MLRDPSSSQGVHPLTKVLRAKGWTVQAAAIEWQFRGPRDEWDEGLDPESDRGRLLAATEALDAAFAKLSADIAALPWYRRWPVRVVLRWKGIRL